MGGFKDRREFEAAARQCILERLSGDVREEHPRGEVPTWFKRAVLLAIVLHALISPHIGK
jgi:hypothetical protein